MKAPLILIPLLATLGSLGLLVAARDSAPVGARKRVDGGALLLAAEPSTSPAYCLGCHDAGRPAPAPVSYERLFRPGRNGQAAASAAKSPPDLVFIDQLAGLYSPVVFDHRVHAVMSEIEGGCANCHHYMPAAGLVQPCRECHPIQRHAGTLDHPSLKGAYHRQCLACHRDWSHANGCGYCHHEQAAPVDVRHTLDVDDLLLPPRPRATPAPTYVYESRNTSAPIVSFQHLDHARSYDLNCVDCHQGGTCAGCHDGALKPVEPDHGMSSCRSCHAANACNFCHDDSSRPQFNHRDRTGWDLDLRHEGVSCVRCHGRVEAFVSPSGNCRACHGGLSAADFDHRVTGIPLAGSHLQFECSRCHDESRADSPASCNGCHANYSYPADWPGRPRPEPPQ